MTVGAVETGTTDAREAHRAFLNRYYGLTHRIYDATRRYYLLGRDRTIARLCTEPWETLVEIGSGTGRNLRLLKRARPQARLAGVDACDAMLEHARARCPWARLMHGFAEDVELGSILGRAPDRILLSYSLSMMDRPGAVLDHLSGQLAPGGELVVVDFADGADLPAPAGRALRRWLARFHVSQLEDPLFAGREAEIEYGAGRYWLAAWLGARAR
ncbi:MAG: methyltransferase domain-containing protein [Spirochaetaceae bacterium]|nr:methyltransferase domain-containing protein [Myxococcales bacterium]MCB9724864.1 methyltransferase domain-containing protein [Spirochaetaceae bacterium]